MFVLAETMYLCRTFGRAVENAQWLLLLHKQQYLVLERTGFGIKTYETTHSHSLPLSRTANMYIYIYTHVMYIYIHIHTYTL